MCGHFMSCLPEESSEIVPWPRVVYHGQDDERDEDDPSAHARLNSAFDEFEYKSASMVSGVAKLS
jgi:hypothetical protein